MVKVIRHDITRIQTDAIAMISTISDDDYDSVFNRVVKAEGTENFEKILSGEIQSENVDSAGHIFVFEAKNIGAKNIICAIAPNKIFYYHNMPEDELEILLETEDICLNIEYIYRDLYKSIITIAQEKKFHSIAIPLYDAYCNGELAFLATLDCMNQNYSVYSQDFDIFIVVYDRYTLEVANKYYPYVERFIDDRYVEENNCNFVLDKTPYKKIPLPSERPHAEFKPFCDLFHSYIARANKRSSSIYNRIGMDRREFSDLQSGKQKPTKPKIYSLAIALKLSWEDTEAFLKSAGFCYLETATFEKKIKDCIEKGQYNLSYINEELVKANCKPIGCSDFSSSEAKSV